MSLLLDALNRASKEKHKAAAAAAPGEAPVEALQWEPLPAAVPEAPAPQPLSGSPPEPPPAPQMEPSAAQRPSAPDTWELSLEPQGAPAVASALPPVRSPPVAEPAEPPAPPPAILVEPVLNAEPAPAPAPAHSPAGNIAPAPRPAAVEPTLQAAAAPAASRAAHSQVAQEILRATAPAPAMAGAGLRRVWMLGGLAAGLALVLGVVFSGLLGDPGELLGLGASSSLGTPLGIAPVPDAAVAPAPPEAPAASAADVAVAASPLVSVSADSALAATPTATPSSRPSDVGTPVASAPSVQAAAAQPSARPHAVAQPVRSSAAKSPAPMPLPTDAGARGSEVTLGAGGLSKSAIATSTRTPGLLEQGYAALLDGRLDAAAQAYRQALRANPQERDALLGLAYISQQQGQRAEAQAYYREVLRQEPSNAIATAGLQSLDERPESSALNPAAGGGAADSAAAMAVAGSALVREGRLADAAQAFARAQSLAPTNPLHAYNHAVAQDRLGRHAVALRLYENVLQLDASAPAALRGYQIETVRTRVAQLRAAVGETPRDTP